MHTLFLAVTADGTEVQKGISYTPVTSKVLNLGSGAAWGKEEDPEALKKGCALD